jgi:glutamine amidotransferase
VHSYYLAKSLESEVLANTIYNHEIPAIIGKKNYFGVQFHPEKSSFAGQKFISNWIKL